MVRTRVILVALLVAIVAGAVVLGRVMLRSTPAQASTGWDDDHVRRDPAGYANWVSDQLDQRIDELGQVIELATAASRNNKVGEWSERYSEAQRVYSRMSVAYERAEDERRWPVKLAGVDFDEHQAVVVMERTKQYLDRNQSKLDQLRQRDKEINDARQALGNEMDSLKRLRTEVRGIVNHEGAPGEAEVAQLRAAALRIPGEQKIPTRASVTELADAAAQSAPEPLDVEQLLKQ